jgi:hypothetical protein
LSLGEQEKEMRVKTLHMVAKIANKISNPSSLTPLYRSVEVGPEGMRCCSEFGNIDIGLDPTGLLKPILVDAVALAAVTSSLPEEGDIELVEKDNHITWKCGQAKGHLNTVQSDYQIPVLDHQQYPWAPDPNFGEALRLASCSCQAAAVSVGLYGITIEPNGDKLNMYSSNSVSLAATSIPKGSYPGGKVTLRPPTPAVTAALVEACGDKCSMDINESGIYILGDWLIAHLPLGIPLEHDLATLAATFSASTQIAKIDTSAVKKFITRARALADRHASFTIGLKVEAGKLALEHQGIASSTEEFFLADGLDQSISYKSVALPADMLLLPLEHVQFVVLDYLAKQQLVLKGADPEFMFAVSGGE